MLKSKLNFKKQMCRLCVWPETGPPTSFSHLSKAVGPNLKFKMVDRLHD